MRVFSRNVVLCGTVMVAVNVYAISTGMDVYLGIDDPGKSSRTYFKDGATLLAQPCRLEPIWAGVDSLDNGPTTNATKDYAGGDDIVSCGLNESTNVGHDALVARVVADGIWDTRIEGGDEVSNKYFVRLFSAASIPNAAYYKDTALLNGANPVPEEFGLPSMTVNLINPAYSFPGGLTATQANNSYVGGTINGLTDNSNSLANTDVKVVWRYADDTAWQDLDTTVEADGSFYADTVVSGPTTVYVRVVGLGAGTPGVNYPFSASLPVTVVPEPALACAMPVLSLLLVMRNKYRAR